MPFFDSYTLRARIQPAFIVALPLAFLLLTFLPGQPILATAFFGLLSTAGGTAVAAQLGRDRGRKKEPGLWDSWDGPPTTRLLRHCHTPGDVTLGLGLRQQVEEWVGYPLPTEHQEETDPGWANEKYAEAVASIREATRDSTKFPLVFSENANYGFRRNLWGLKPIGAPIAATLALLSWTLMLLTVWGRPWPDPWWNVLVDPDSVAVIRLAVALLDTVLAAFWLLWVKPSWVKVAAEAYAIRLMESVQTLKRDIAGSSQGHS